MGRGALPDLFGRLKVIGVEPKFVLNRFSARQARHRENMSPTPWGGPLLGHLCQGAYASLEHAVGPEGQKTCGKWLPAALLTRSYEAARPSALRSEHQGREKRNSLMFEDFRAQRRSPRGAES